MKNLLNIFLGFPLKPKKAKKKENPDDYAYKYIKTYEKYSGYKVGPSFKMGWTMARLKNKHLGIK